MSVLAADRVLSYREEKYPHHHDGDRIVEVRNGSEEALTQNVWGTQYVDKLVQVAVNRCP